MCHHRLVALLKSSSPLSIQQHSTIMDMQSSAWHCNIVFQMQTIDGDMDATVGFATLMYTCLTPDSLVCCLKIIECGGAQASSTDTVLLLKES